MVKMENDRHSYPCELCDKRFPIKSLYKSHQKKVHGVKKWECEYCHRRFAERSTLRNHIRTHTKETPFGCEMCGKKFSHRATLLNHKKTHNTDKKHKCEYCGKGFHRKSNMKRHIQVVHLKNKQKFLGPRRTYGAMSRGMAHNFHQMLAARMGMPHLIADSAESSPVLNPRRGHIKMPPMPMPIDQVMRTFFTVNKMNGMNSIPSLRIPNSAVPSYPGYGMPTEQIPPMQGKVLEPSKINFPPPFPPQTSLKDLMSGPKYPSIVRGSIIKEEENRAPVAPHAIQKTVGGMPQTQPVRKNVVGMPPQGAMIKEEPRDDYGFGVISAPSLDTSRSTSPIIGDSNVMMKEEDEDPIADFRLGTSQAASVSPSPKGLSFLRTFIPATPLMEKPKIPTIDMRLTCFPLLPNLPPAPQLPLLPSKAHHLNLPSPRVAKAPGPNLMNMVPTTMVVSPKVGSSTAASSQSFRFGPPAATT